MTLRIGLLCHSSVGGSVNVAVNLAHGLARRGHDVHVFSRTAPPGVSPAAHGLSLHTLGSTEVLDPRLRVVWPHRDHTAFVELVADVGRRYALNILHFHYALPFAEIAHETQRALGPDAPAVVGTLHGTDVRHDHAARVASILEEVDAITTVSRSQAALAVRELGLCRRPQVIANTVDLRRFRAVGGKSRANRPPRVVHVSNFRAVKDPIRLARAFVEVHRRCAAELWLVGDGDEMPRVKAILDRGGVMGAVRVLGLRTDVETLYRQADVLVLTSRWESFSLVALEAAACGIPVVAPRVGGLPEVVVDGRTGVLYDLADPAEPARTLLDLLTDDDRRAGMGAAAARHARAFCHERGVRRYEALYRETLARRALRRPLQMNGSSPAR